MSSTILNLYASSDRLAESLSRASRKADVAVAAVRRARLDFEDFVEKSRRLADLVELDGLGKEIAELQAVQREAACP